MPDPFSNEFSKHGDEDLVASIANEISRGDYDPKKLAETTDEHAPNGESVAFLKELEGIEFKTQTEKQKMERLLGDAREAVITGMDRVFEEAITDSDEITRVVLERHEKSGGKYGTADVFHESVNNALDLYASVRRFQLDHVLSATNAELAESFDTAFRGYIKSVAGNIPLQNLRQAFGRDRLSGLPDEHGDGKPKTQDEKDLEDRIWVLRQGTGKVQTDEDRICQSEVHHLLENKDPLRTIEVMLNADYDDKDAKIKASSKVPGGAVYAQLGSSLAVLVTEAQSYYRSAAKQHREWLEAADVPEGEDLHAAMLNVSIAARTYMNISSYTTERAQYVASSMLQEAVWGKEAAYVRLGGDEKEDGTKPFDLKAWMAETDRPDPQRAEGPLTPEELAEIARITKPLAEAPINPRFAVPRATLHMSDILNDPALGRAFRQGKVQVGSKIKFDAPDSTVK